MMVSHFCPRYKTILDKGKIEGIVFDYKNIFQMCIEEKLSKPQEVYTQFVFIMFIFLIVYQQWKIRGGASILMYTHYPKKRKYTYTLIYINIHKLKTDI